MLHLIAYDIADARRLRKIARICRDYGSRVEYSVFECDLEESVFLELWTRLLKILDPKKDRLVAYRLCAVCLQTALRAGVEPPPPKPRCYVF